MKKSVAWFALAVTAACGPSPITTERLERSVGPTFNNLVRAQLDRMGFTPPTAGGLAVIAACQKVATGSGTAGSFENRGSGEWQCAIDWHTANGQTLRDTYDLAVGADGCYAATIDGAESQVGGPTVQTRDGRTVRNLLYTFEGCFDTT